MGWALTTSATDQKPLIGTTSLASCAGIAIYDPEKKIAGVAHAFFNGKTSITVYSRDHLGHDIPSTARTLIIDDPHPFAPFVHLTMELLSKLDALGGKQYKFYVFNIQYGCRIKDQNIALENVVENVRRDLETQGKLLNFEYRNEQGFVLDTRNGNIQPLQ